MDIATSFGFIFGLFLIISAIFLRAGVRGLLGFLDLPSVFITFGGTIAATLINYPLKQVLKVFGIAKKVLLAKEENPLDVINKIVDLTKKARTQGLLSIEEDVKKLDNEFLKKGFSMVLAGLEENAIREELETELIFLRERHRIGQEIFITLGTYSPAFGMIGTIMGLIMMLARIEDQSQIAAGMAVALLTTFYGALAAYLVFLPVAGKLRRRSEDEVLVKEVIIEGILSMKKGEIPSIIERKLLAFLPPKMREKK
ncbi:MAG: motility protein A [Caldiserica bacterium]|nr:MAG: motility protein A [Caldisericota bacterium]